MAAHPQEESLGSLVEDFDRGAAGHQTGEARGSPARPAFKAFIVVALLFAVGYVVFSSIGSGESDAAASRRRHLICSETGEAFPDYKIADDSAPPWSNPKTGKNTLYIAEMCYWTRDGGVKIPPTYVLVKETAGQSGPTVCPDCGREVVFRNPTPPTALLLEAEEASARNR